MDGGPPVSDFVSTSDEVALVDVEGCCVADVVRAVVVSDVDVDVDAGTETVIDTEGLGNKDRVCEWVVVADTV